MLAHVESVVAEFSVYPVIAEVIRLSQTQLDVVRGWVLSSSPASVGILPASGEGEPRGDIFRDCLV